MSEYEGRMCHDCKEKCDFYKEALKRGDIPFGCSEPIDARGGKEE